MKFLLMFELLMPDRSMTTPHFRTDDQGLAAASFQTDNQGMTAARFQTDDQGMAEGVLLAEKTIGSIKKSA